MKKFLALMLTLAMALSLAACGGDKGGETTPPPADSQQESQPADTGSSGGDEAYNISVILKTTASEYWGYVVAGANA